MNKKILNLVTSGIVVIGMVGCSQEEIEDAKLYFSNPKEAIEMYNMILKTNTLGAVEYLNKHCSGNCQEELEIAKSIAQKKLDGDTEEQVVDRIRDVQYLHTCGYQTSSQDVHKYLKEIKPIAEQNEEVQVKEKPVVTSVGELVELELSKYGVTDVEVSIIDDENTVVFVETDQYVSEAIINSIANVCYNSEVFTQKYLTIRVCTTAGDFVYATTEGVD